MSFNIMDMVKGQISDQLIGQIGGLLGESPDKARNAIDSAVPTLLAGIGESAQNANGADTLFNLVNRQDDNIVDNIGAMIGSNQSSELIESGTRGLGSMLGNKGVTSMISGLSGHTGLGKGSAGSLLGMLTPMVMGQLKRKAGSDGLNASGLASMLKSQGSNISASMPAGMLKQLEAAGFGESDVSMGAPTGGGYSTAGVTAGVAAAGAGVAAAAGSVSRGAGNVASGAADAARGAASSVSHTASNVAGSAAGAAGSAARGVSGAASGAVDAGRNAADAAGRGVSHVAGSAADAAGNAGRTVSGAAGSAVDATRSAASGAVDATRGAAGSAANAAGNAGRAVTGAASGAVSGAADATRSAASGAADTARNAASSVGNVADRATDTARNAASSAGRAVDRGVDAAGNKVGGAVDSTRQAASNTTRSVKDTTHSATRDANTRVDSARGSIEAPRKSGGFWKWLIPLLIAAAAWFGFKQMGTKDVDVSGTVGDVTESATGVAGDAVDATKDAAAGAVDATKDATAGAVDATKDAAAGAVDATQDAATSAVDATSGAVTMPSMEMPEMPGLPEGMSEELSGAFSGATTALGSITDVDSAKAALPSLDGLTGIMDKVPEAARGPLSGMVGNLTPMLDKASAIPGVGDVLAPALEKLKGFM